MLSYRVLIRLFVVAQPSDKAFARLVFVGVARFLVCFREVMSSRTQFSYKDVSFSRLPFHSFYPSTHSNIGEPSSPRTMNLQAPDSTSWVRATDLPLEWERPQQSMPGLINLGNTCYMNAALQCLIHLPTFTAALTNFPCQRSSANYGRNGYGYSSNSVFCGHCSIIALARKMCARECRAVSPKSLAMNLRALSPNLRLNRMEDSMEFIYALLRSCMRAHVLGCMRTNRNRADLTEQQERATPVGEVFGFIMQNRIECRSCSHVSKRDENFREIAVDVRKARSVQEGLQQFCAVEQLNGANKYECCRCKRLVDATKRFAFRQAPNVLTIQLKRFHGNGYDKNSKMVSYTPQLDLAPLMIGKPKHIEAKYNLTGLIVHSGRDTRCGHYYAYVKNSNGTWSLKDDSSQRVVRMSEVLAQRAYVLFYTRIAPKVKLFKKVQNPSGISQGLTIDQQLLAVTTKPAREDSNSTYPDGGTSSRSQSPTFLHGMHAVRGPSPTSSGDERPVGPLPSARVGNISPTVHQSDAMRPRSASGPVLSLSESANCEVRRRNTSPPPEVPMLDLSSITEKQGPTSPSVLRSMKKILVVGMETAKTAMYRVFGRDKANGFPPNDPPSETPTPPPEPQAEPRTKPQPKSRRRNAQPTSSNKGQGLFGRENVGTWDGSANDDRRHLAEPRSTISKRRRASDALDEEYDAGKAKRVRLPQQQANKDAFSSFANRKTAASSRVNGR